MDLNLQGQCSVGTSEPHHLTPTNLEDSGVIWGNMMIDDRSVISPCFSVFRFQSPGFSGLLPRTRRAFRIHPGHQGIHGVGLQESLEILCRIQWWKALPKLPGTSSHRDRLSKLLENQNIWQKINGGKAGVLTAGYKTSRNSFKCISQHWRRPVAKCSRFAIGQSDSLPPLCLFEAAPLLLGTKSQNAWNVQTHINATNYQPTDPIDPLSFLNFCNHHPI